MKKSHGGFRPKGEAAGLIERIVRGKNEEGLNRKSSVSRKGGEAIGLECGDNRKGQRDERTRRGLIGKTMKL